MEIEVKQGKDLDHFAKRLNLSFDFSGNVLMGSVYVGYKLQKADSLLFVFNDTLDKEFKNCIKCPDDCVLKAEGCTSQAIAKPRTRTEL